MGNYMQGVLTRLKEKIGATHSEDPHERDILFLMSRFEHGIDTNEMGPDPVRVNLFYPRSDNNPDTVILELYDVRASNNLHISFDFPRNGWSIKSNLSDPELCEEQSEELHEVAFVTAWPQKGE